MGVRHRYLRESTLHVGDEVFTVDAEGDLSPDPSPETTVVLLALANYSETAPKPAKPKRRRRTTKKKES